MSTKNIKQRDYYDDLALRRLKKFRDDLNNLINNMEEGDCFYGNAIGGILDFKLLMSARDHLVLARAIEDSVERTIKP